MKQGYLICSMVKSIVMIMIELKNISWPYSGFAKTRTKIICENVPIDSEGGNRAIPEK